MAADQWTAAARSLREGGSTASLRAEGDIHLHHTLSWLGQQAVPVIGGEMPGDSEDWLCPAAYSGCHYPYSGDVEVVQLLWQ